MTNCTAVKLEFPALKRRKIQAEFSGGAITSDGGVLLLRAIDQRLKSTLKLNNHRLKPVGLNNGLKVRIRVDSTTRLNQVPF